VVATSAVVLAASCSGQSGTNGHPGAVAGGRGGGPPVFPVEMITLAPKPVEQAGEFVGTVKSRRSNTIQPQVEGIITSIPVKSGDRVSPGALLFAIDATPEQAALASLQSVRAAREADAGFARQQADRARALLAAGAGSKQEFEQSEALLKAAEAQLKATDEQIKQQQATLAYYRLVAPTAGTVGDIPVRVGDRVTKSTVLTHVEDNSGLEVYVNVPVQQAPSVRVGQPLRIVNDTGATIVERQVDFVSPSVDDQTQTVLVKSTLSDRAQFRSDQFVRVKIVLSRVPSLTVPIIAVNRINGQYFAFVAEPTKEGGLVARQRAVTVGPVVGNEYVVLSGLKAGEKLIVGGLQKLGDGSPVQELQAPPKTGTGPAPPKPAGTAGEGGRGGK